MLLSLHVKNLALIEEEEVTFADGLNILTGETGAGKSIIIGSVNLALGAKADKAMIRTGADCALIEMVFRADNERQSAKLKEMDIPLEEDGTILIKRKIYPDRSVCTIEGEKVTLKQMREISELLIDIYGQRENQRLLRREAQMGVLDAFAGDPDRRLRESVAAGWRTYRDLKSEWDKGDLDGSARAREIDLLQYEIQEIDDAALREGEDAELEARYRKMNSFRRICDAAGEAGQIFAEGEESAASEVERALRALRKVEGIDSDLDAICSQLSDIDSLMSDCGRALSEYIDGMNFDPGEFAAIEDRLNLINHLKDKYGRSIPQIQEAREKRAKRLEALSDYEGTRAKLKKDMEAERVRLLDLCRQLSEVRRSAAKDFTKRLTAELLDLNFNQVDFHVEVDSSEEYLSQSGFDRVSFTISMNPGESPRPLEAIASGGELSRIMLALKTVFAGKDDIYTFIFDEIDSGISGQTAWKVAEKLGRLSANHQILCITHLPQIAAMEDAHYRIAKTTDGRRTVTHITRLNEEESVREIARLLGTATVTEATLENARELKRQAKEAKNNCK